MIPRKRAIESAFWMKPPLVSGVSLRRTRPMRSLAMMTRCEVSEVNGTLEPDNSGQGDL